MATDSAKEAQEFSSRDFRNTVSVFATGVNVITTRGEKHAYGMTANAFTSVSLDPPLVLVCVDLGAEGRTAIEGNGAFAVNVLSAEQEPISRYFASKDRPRGRDAFSEISHHEAVTGSPIIDGVCGHLDCRLHASHEAGDHLIFIGEVVSIGSDPEIPPLLFHGGAYGLLNKIG
jgi:flavin reductase (DIM6/NTAB) family NADH-FMN oxidoreductase RutF